MICNDFSIENLKRFVQIPFPTIPLFARGTNFFFIDTEFNTDISLDPLNDSYVSTYTIFDFSLVKVLIRVRKLVFFYFGVFHCILY